MTLQEGLGSPVFGDILGNTLEGNLKISFVVVCVIVLLLKLIRETFLIKLQGKFFSLFCALNIVSFFLMFFTLLLIKIHLCLSSRGSLPMS